MHLMLKVRQPSFTLLYCTQILSDALSMQCSCNQSSTQERNDIEPSRSMHMHTHNNTQCSLCYTSTLAAALSSQGALLPTVFVITGLWCQRKRWWTSCN